MGNFSWTFDAPTGVYKNHAMSSKLRHAAIEETKFMQFVTAEPGYGKKKGESITITRVSSLKVPTDGRIAESVNIPQDDLVLTTIAVTVTEWGRSVPFTSLSEDLSEFNPENIIQRNLMDQMKQTMDQGAAGAFKIGQIKAVATSVGETSFTTNGVPFGPAGANMNVFQVESIRDFMFDNLAMPHFASDDYMCLISVKAKRGIINDPAWEPWKRYLDPAAKFNSEIGRLEGVRFIEINHARALSRAIGTNGVAGEAVFFGADAVIMAVAEDPELRMEIPKDFGRKKAVAWYGILEFGQTWGDSSNLGEARVVHFTST